MSHHQFRRATALGQPTAGRNPWIVESTDDPVRAPDTTAATPAPPSGPKAPHPGVPTPDAVDRLPRRQMPTRAALWWVGAHGGAGETTLAALLPASRSTGHAWPVVPGSEVSQVMLVARTSMRGLRATQRAAGEWASASVPSVELLGLVLVADAPGRLPRPLRDFAAVVAGGVPRTWHLPWVESWRLGETPTPETAPREVRRLLGDVHALISTPPVAGHGAN